MKRYSFWRTALADYVHRVAHLSFQWGEHDCALFAAGAVEVMTGEDIAAPYRGRYKTMAGGLRAMRKTGHDDHVAYFASLFEEIHPSHATVGDIAVIAIDEGEALGVVQGERIYAIGPGETRIGTVPLGRASRAFRVPFTD